MKQSFLPSRIRQARRYAKLTQSSLAARLDVVPSAVAQWERHPGTSPIVKHMAEIALVTRVSFDWLATGRGPMTTEPTEAPTFSADAFAMDEVEESVLRLMRIVPSSARHTVLQFLEGLAKR